MVTVIHVGGGGRERGGIGVTGKGKRKGKGVGGGVPIIKFIRSFWNFHV